MRTIFSIRVAGGRGSVAFRGGRHRHFSLLFL